MIYETGGLLVDHGWIRILGSGSTRLDRSIMEWNKGKSYQRQGQAPSFLLVADDVLGGFFAINYGGIADTGKSSIFYFSPDIAAWEPLEMNYSEFLHFLFYTDLEAFYKGLRWKGWEEEIKTLGGSQAISCSPPLFTKEGADIENLTRVRIPVQELWDFHFHKE